MFHSPPQFRIRIRWRVLGCTSSLARLVPHAFVRASWAARLLSRVLGARIRSRVLGCTSSLARLVLKRIRSRVLGSNAFVRASWTRQISASCSPQALRKLASTRLMLASTRCMLASFYPSLPHSCCVHKPRSASTNARFSSLRLRLCLAPPQLTLPSRAAAPIIRTPSRHLRALQDSHAPMRELAVGLPWPVRIAATGPPHTVCATDIESAVS